ncbi:MAG: hypothetical protein AAF824_13370 [Bacteroidota bacterium]
MYLAARQAVSGRRGILSLLCLLTLNLLPAQPLDMELFESMEARSIGPAGMSGRVTAVDVIHDDPSHIYVGTASGGLWESKSGGISWEPIFDDQDVASIGALAIYQKNPSIIWAGTGEGNPRNSQTSGAGIYLSRDGGKSWELKGLKNTRNIHRILIHPDNPNVVYAGVQGSAWGTHPERGIFKTTDGGDTWNKILFTNDSTGVGDMVMDPTNPDKIMVSMWEFRRWPWFFKSGGKGSGIHVTHDGGNSWKKLSSDDGLPKGELGRIGLAIAPSSPNIVYAWVESKKNALYKSMDGGASWKKVNDKPEIGNRPFYYADIYVDPENENRLYSIYSMVSISEDGGKSFKVMLPYDYVHPDHHVWWIHPENASFIINGNDGGMAISRDKGDSWQFVENLPLAQFYHINYDMDYPYHVYGGMQDNGSWRGPAYIWRAGGIRNAYWDELYFGDGFDVVPDPVQPRRYGYAMSQGGSLGRYDRHTGYTRRIKPVHPEGVPLRFNWNAGIAQDPFDESTIYYGSQFVHKSTDKGNTWTIISPDLTTNDSTKQQQQKSGGLTYDVTQAENHTTILTINPSPLNKDIIWVGTDDGNLQLTQDGGKTWTNLIGNISGVPANSWIPFIHVSNKEAAEAFVVINNYRRNDWTPWVFHTTDYGTTWTRIVDEDKVWGYAISFVQDPVAENLLFLGTEFGLYVSVDKGDTWTKWTHGFPTVSTSDLKIHPREQDLVIGTFGRAAFVLDDIRPLREIALRGEAVTQQMVYAFPTPDAILASRRQASGTRFYADGMFAGENRSSGAMISYWAIPASKKDTARIKIYDGDVCIRSLTQVPDSGINRIQWRMDQKGVRGPGSPRPKAGARERGGYRVIPGTYEVVVELGGQESRTSLEVLGDPRLNISQAQYKAAQEKKKELEELTSKATKATDALMDSKESLKKIKSMLPADTAQHVEIRKQIKALTKEIDAFMVAVNGDDKLQGIVRTPTTLNAKLRTARSYIYSNNEMPRETLDIVYNEAKDKVGAFLQEVNTFMKDKWQPFENMVSNASLSPFKPFEPVSLE